MTKNKFYLWDRSARDQKCYSKAHAHTSAAILNLLLTGKGYTMSWPEHLGVNPWRDGKGDEVVRVDYEYGGGCVSATGRCTLVPPALQCSNELFRLTALGSVRTTRACCLVPHPEQKTIDYTAMDIHEGRDIDPLLDGRRVHRNEFHRQLEINGATSRMEPHRYEKPAELS